MPVRIFALIEGGKIKKYSGVQIMNAAQKLKRKIFLSQSILRLTAQREEIDRQIEEYGTELQKLTKDNPQCQEHVERVAEFYKDHKQSEAKAFNQF